MDGRTGGGAAAPPARGTRTLVLGGARSGKSTYAEASLADEASVVYVATGGSRDEDAEWQDRIRAHRARRPQSWVTVETTDLVPVLLAEGPPLLVDCLSLWLTALLDETGAWDDATWRTGGRDRADRHIEALLDAVGRSSRQLVLVTNEVGSGVVPAHASGRLFRDELGRLNARVARICDDVVLVVAGRPLRLPSGAATIHHTNQEPPR